jgi:tRNA(Ile)-lysidine synthase|nr:tRNA lysidine(34) synthetase TilS [Candidatus Krumholzibacteria bacterium]
MSGSPFLKAAAHRIGELVAAVCPDEAQPGLLVALSGGPDSVALLLAAHHWAQDTGGFLAAAHLDHKLRGEASTTDAAFCRDLCQRLEIPLHEKAEDPRPVANRRGQGLEEAARHLRLDFLTQVLSQDPRLHCVAKGQHRDDQLETLVTRFFRGAGTAGMAGILPVSGPYIHPLLDFSRAEILAFLEGIHQPWRSDASNLDGQNIRARLRRELLPVAQEVFGEGFAQAPLRLGRLMAQDQEYLDQVTRAALAPLALPEGGLALDGLLDLHPAIAQRVLKKWISRPMEPSGSQLAAVHVMNILDGLREGQSGAGWDLPGGWRLTRQFDVLSLDGPHQGPAAERPAADFRLLVQPVDPVQDPEALGLAEGAGLRDDLGRWNLSCPSDVLQGNLRIRNPRPGDRFQPFGLDGTRKLSDLFRDHRIPESRRPGVLVVEDEVGILWIVGLARAERTRLLPTGGRIVTICVAER